MKAAKGSRRDRLRAMLADLKMPGALEALDAILSRVDGGQVTPSEAIEELLHAQLRSLASMYSDGIFENFGEWVAMMQG